jgi:hypothetical protein
MFVSPVKTQLKPARSAESFVDSIGVVVHLNYTDTPYGKFDEIIKPKLQELGIRHIRDGLTLEDLNTNKKFKDLGNIGIKSTLVMDPRDNNTPSRAVNVVKSILDFVDAVEGPNEWDISPQLQYKGQNFPEGIRKFQAELYSAIKSDSATSHLPVVSPSMAYAPNASILGSVACDIGNMHSYPGGAIPSTGLDNLWIPNIKTLCGAANKPLISTECGYHNGIDIEGGHPGVSEQVAAKYLLRLYFEYFNRGIERAFTHELIDPKPPSPQEWNFGLLRADGSPKPAFIGLKNLITLLKEDEEKTSSLFSPSSLDINFKGDKTNIHYTLLQKQNGKFYLIFWQEVPSFNHKTKTDIIVPKRPLNLIFNTPISQVTTYQPVNSIAPIKRYKNPKQLELKVPDHPLIIELVPKPFPD